MTQTRDLAWDGCLNVRDLGGHRATDGGETRFGQVVRADSVRTLTDAGWEAAVAYGVRTVVDLRMDRELAEDPPADLPVEVLHVPFLVDDEEAFAEADRLANAAPDYAAATRDVYVVFLERFRENVGRAIRAVAHAGEGAVVVHCVGGKDRTGLVTGLLLHLAGVDFDQIGADYALSEERLRPRHDVWLAEADTEAERERVRRTGATPAAAIVGALEEIERRYGSLEAYLRAGGLSDEDLRLARARLRG